PLSRSSARGRSPTRVVHARNRGFLRGRAFAELRRGRLLAPPWGRLKHWNLPVDDGASSRSLHRMSLVGLREGGAPFNGCVHSVPSGAECNFERRPALKLS